MALRIGFGIVSCQRPTASDQSWHDVYADGVHLVGVAEQHGFDSAWVTEHHFTDDGYLGASFVMLGALAATTSTITLGTNVVLAPMWHPLRLAEDAATVAAIAGGRLILGLGIGYRDAEFAGFGVPMRERVPRIVEHVEVCRKAFTGEPFSHHGAVLDVDDLVLRPAAPGPPAIWLGGWVDPAIDRAGALADGYLAPNGALRDVARRVERLDRAAAAAGRDRLRLPISTLTSVAVSDDGTVSSRIVAGLEHMMANYGDWYSSSSDWGGGREFGEKIKAAAGPLAGVAAGTPDEVLERLVPLATAWSGERDHHLVLRLHYPGMGRTEAVDHIERFAGTVMPALRAAAG